MNYYDAINLLLALPDLERKNTGPLARSMSLETMQKILQALGNPHANRPTIHVTGSKGKGSTSAFIAGFLHAAGLSTALYTSPHLHDYVERIAINMAPVSRDIFARAVQEIAPALHNVHRAESAPVSTFGAMTAVFFFLARQLQVDWQIVEVGMGGLFDATNVFATKEVAVITPVSLEHTAILGSTAAEIARNKSGIITSGSTVILAPQVDPVVDEVIAATCAEKGADLVNVRERYQIRDRGVEPLSEHTGAAHHQSCVIATELGERVFTLKMPGQHQQNNLATAVATIDTVCRLDSRVRLVSDAAARVFVPGRVEQLLSAPRVVVDGAHNGESAFVLSQALMRHFSFRRCIVMLGVNSDKNLEDILLALKPSIDVLIATRSQSEKAMEPEKIQQAAVACGIDCSAYDSAASAIEYALSIADSEDLVCITGSLYLVGEAREFFGFGTPSELWQAAPEALLSGDTPFFRTESGTFFPGELA